MELNFPWERSKEQQIIDNINYIKYTSKLNKLSEDELISLIEKVIKKYDSDEYVNREYKIGYQPREELVWRFEGYFREKYGTDASEKYYGMFSTDVWFLKIKDKKWMINEISGQGCAIVIIPENEIDGYLKQTSINYKRENQKLILRTKYDDGCTYIFTETIPFEYESKEDFLEFCVKEFQREDKDDVEILGCTFYGKKEEDLNWVLANVFTLEEWFNKYKENI